MKPILDLRSDTLTRPSPQMREVMARAVVGDSFYDEDPTVRELEQRVAELFGHEAALFVPSGTMSNQIALQLHCAPGDAVFCAADNHILRAETGALAALAGLQPVVPELIDGFKPSINSLDELYVAPGSFVAPATKLLALENTHLFSGGRIHDLGHLQQLSSWCRTKGLAIHLDGARLWHAHVESGTPLSVYGGLFDTLSVCFSKGLGAPVGSCLIASQQHIHRAKLLRKRLGGTMRQAGILAAGALWALENHIPELKQDHRKASFLASWLKALLPQAEVANPETNIVLLKFQESAIGLLEELKQKYGLQLSALNPKTLRAVCHRDVSLAQLENLGQ
ncbi:MAG: low specificity L-threonine aldolase [Betaproteobacteria bacterium]|nr:low specificity L-threonine aldolase [Betaproteobacteria bacterium]